MVNMELREKHADIVDIYAERVENFELFQGIVRKFFESRSLATYVHSIRHRIKSIDHLLDKIERKNIEDAGLEPQSRKGEIHAGNVFSRITDIAGIRVLHLHISQFQHIHGAIMAWVKDGEFTLLEEPKAYTWDHDSEKYFKSLGILHELKGTYYTSIHYVLRPNSRSPATCEVQVRTLLEEVWGEVDHSLNYPTPSVDRYCQEQIRVLARLEPILLIQ
jgi:putative GTP pyrophosphokinase